MFIQQTLKTANTDEEIAFKQKEKDMAQYARSQIAGMSDQNQPLNLGPITIHSSIPILRLLVPAHLLAIFPGFEPGHLVILGSYP